ncbi:50S ribosomal protein L23 [candidate division WWE3 bacterium]|uniref:Large ribosomal subunit protein uL23 n=1 Tax=candidate division WWE3 bacterium TaxID=2053526 RepID=A0A3A4ZAM9_UNCKA|nr:MAG: 50S ribosomal protein L23 [candidate division WWE3 bacterium]
MRINEAIIRPIVTEKTMAQLDQNKYVFEVDMSVSKGQVVDELRSLFGVDVVDVKSSILPGKKIRQGKTFRFKKGAKRKKVTVTLKEGQKLDIVSKES